MCSKLTSGKFATIALAMAFLSLVLASYVKTLATTSAFMPEIP